ncbi:MAG: hypothetical protein AAFX85_03660 [Pseudomonadota bacterium]
MSSSFTVITTASHHFGDHEGMFEKEDPTATFVGASHSTQFDVAGIDEGQQSLLMFRSFNVNFRTNVLSINGQVVERAISRSVEREWKTQLVVLPAGVVKAGANTVTIESRTRTGETEGNLDDFIVTDLVLQYAAS